MLTIEKDNLVIRIPINKDLPPSSTGKNRLLASTRGNVRTTFEHQGKPVTVSVNAYIPA